MIGGGDCGIDLDNKTRIFTFYVRRYLEDLKFAVTQYTYELNTDLEKLNGAREALEKMPQLL